MGQACTAANRFLVHRSVAGDFTRRFADRMAGLRDVGPLIDAAARSKVASLVDDAVRKGARVLCGGRAPGGDGHFYPPTVLTDVPSGARLTRAEIFGPVAPISTFDDEAEALARANDTEYGLVAYLFTRDLSRAVRVGEALEFGMVGVNQGIVSNPAAPFGGMKASGFGREGGAEGIDEYLETKYLGLAV
jgi:succinate-semialdehyde dehydrogenase/glutarate-semialdehyde dehydrogenase